DLYIELEQLEYIQDDEENNYKWKISSRWIKYEQTIDPETEIWSKPFIGALEYQNLAYLKQGLRSGTVILNPQRNTFEEITDEIIQDFINRGQMNRDHKLKLKSLILSQHRDHLTIAGAMTGKKAPISELFSSNLKHSHRHSHSHISFTEHFGSSMIKKGGNFSRQNSRFDDSLQNSDPQIDEKKQNYVKFYVPSHSDLASCENNLHHHHHHHHAAHHHKNFKSTFNLIKNSFHHSKSKHSDLNSSQDIESFVIMVGDVDFLDKPIMAFVRFDKEQFLDHFVDFEIKLRFMFIFLGPKSKTNINYLEIGRCMGTLMANKEFLDCAFNAKNKPDILNGIRAFTNKSLCLVLPIGDFDEDLLAPLIDWMKLKMSKKQKLLKKNKNEKIDKSLTSKKDSLTLNSKENFDPFKRINKPFGCLINEIKHRYSKYFSDIADGLNIHCMIAICFIFTVCIAPALCFGGILADKTKQSFGVNEMLVATSINGIVFGLFSGQPLMIFGATGPFLVFEEMLYNFCVKKLCIEFLPTRIWVSFWVLIFTLIMLASEFVFVIHFVTRFTEEIFAFLIAIVFLADAIKKIFYYFQKNPIYKSQRYCELFNETTYSMYSKQAVVVNDNNSTNTTEFHTNNRCFQMDTIYQLDNKPAEPNIALISLILLIGTCAMALLLKKLRRSNFFGSYIRRTLSDVGILISIILMMAVDYCIRQRTEINTQKLDIPDELTPTKPRDWFVSPFGIESVLPIWVPFLSIVPAFLIFIVLFFEVELTGIILLAKHRKLKKGTGFNLDLLLGALMMTFNSLFGLPWMCSAPVRTLAHWASLSIYSTSIIPGEKPKLMDVKEQRVTSILVHIAIGLCLKGKFILKAIPVPVLFGIFLYFGIVSLSGTQLYDRIKFTFIPFKYCPNVPYAIGIRPSKRNIYTLIQICAVIILMVLKSLVDISFLFPIVLVLLVPFRKFLLTKFFTHRELELLDEENESQEDDMVHDFYELTHLPI
ncbi:unnamed protein product, partial [Brachionus calyciflorus]